MSHSIRIPVDVSNPGEFFACCGLLELSHHLWPGATGAFDSGAEVFQVTAPKGGDLSALLRQVKSARLGVEMESGTGNSAQDGDASDADNPGAVAISLGEPFNLRMDWWADKSLKPWAGSMNAQLIIHAMRAAIEPGHEDPFGDLRVVHDPPETNPSKKKSKKREPFYFDARRGGSAKSLDVGFAPDSFNMTSAACPAVEFLCMVGLQRFRPMPTGTPRVFEYRAWTVPLSPCTAAAAACGLLPGARGERYRFENAFRTDQRKHKGFLPARRVTEGEFP